MNIWALSCIIRASDDVVLQIMQSYEKLEKKRYLRDYEIEEVAFLTILVEDCQLHPSDKEIFLDLFRLQDKRNKGVANIKEVLVSCAAVTAKDIPSLFSIAFQIFDRTNERFLSKPDLVLIAKVINDTCSYVGDKCLHNDQVHDLINSLYTTAGKIDGDIYYPDYINYIAMHPIIQVLISIQFQGPYLNKLLDDEEIDRTFASSSNH